MSGLSETAVIKVNADDQNVRALFQAIGDGFDRMERKIQSVNRKQQTLTDTVGGMIRNYAQWQTLIGIGTQALERHNQELQKSINLNRQAEDAAMKFALQAGNFKMKDEGFMAAIGPIAVRNKMSVQQTAQAATQLLSSGFSESDVLEGGVTDAFLQSLQALTQSGKADNPAELAKAMTKWLNATKQGRTADSVRAAGNQVFNLFGATDLQMNDMVDLAGVAAGMTEAGMSPSEILGAYTSVLGVAKSPSEAATAVGSIVNILTGSKSNKAAVGALERAGMTPADVDLIGERFPDVLDRLAAGVGRLAPEDRMPFYGELFGRERQSIAAGLIGARGEVRKNSAIMGGADAYQNAINYYRSTMIAAEAESTARDELSAFGQGRTLRENAMYMEDENRKLREMGVPGFVRHILGWGNQAVNWAAPDAYNWGAKTFGGMPPKMEVELVTPGGERKPATAKQKALQGGF